MLSYSPQKKRDWAFDEEKKSSQWVSKRSDKEGRTLEMTYTKGNAVVSIERVGESYQVRARAALAGEYASFEKAEVVARQLVEIMSGEAFK